LNGFAASIVLASLALVACGKEAASLVGRWEPAEQFDSGFAGVLDLHDDGTVASGMVVQVSFTYSVEGSTLDFSSPAKGSSWIDMGRSENGRVQISIEGEEMLFDGVPARRRVGRATPGVHPIVGVWTYEHYTNSTAYERFSADGRVDLRIPMPGRSMGRYTVSDSTLTLQYPESQRAMPFEIEDQLLTLTEKGDGPRTLRRVPRWYPFTIDDAEIARLAETEDNSVLSLFSLDPKHLSLGLVRPGSPVVRSVKLVSQDPNFDMSNVAVTLEGENGEALQWAEHFSTAITPALGMNAVDIELSLNGLPAGFDGSFRGVMVIKTGHPSKPQELVRFAGVARSR
jgi:hypothetical protein